MSRKPQTSVYLVSAILMIIVLTGLALSYNFDRVNRERVQAQIQELNVKPEKIESLTPQYVGRFQGTSVFIDDRLRFVASELITSEDGSFLIKTQTLTLAVLAQDSLKVGTEFPSVSLKIEGNLKENTDTAGEAKLLVTEVSPSFYIQETELSKPESDKLVETMKALGLDLSLSNNEQQTSDMKIEASSGGINVQNKENAKYKLTFQGRRI